MKKRLWVIATLLLLALVAGCGSDKEKGINRHKDLPRAGPAEEGK